MATANTVTPTKACFPIPSSHLHLHSCLMTQHLLNPHTCHFKLCNFYSCWSRWPRSLREGSAATRLTRLLVPILPGAWMNLLWVLCVVR